MLFRSALFFVPAFAALAVPHNRGAAEIACAALFFVPAFAALCEQKICMMTCMTCMDGMHDTIIAQRCRDCTGQQTKKTAQHMCCTVFVPAFAAPAVARIRGTAEIACAALFFVPAFAALAVACVGGTAEIACAAHFPVCCPAQSRQRCA